MGYVLRKLGAGSNLEITQAEYEAIQNAKAMYVQLIRVEQNFDAVIEDYVELENTISNYAVRYLAFHLMDESDAFDAVQGTISRRIVHVLATARLYRDALRQHGKAVLKAAGTFQQIETALKDAPNQPMSFRIVEALRNYSQHSALPISSMMAGSQWESSETERMDRAAYFIAPRIDAIKVSRDRKLATDVRAELTKLGEEAEIIGHIRRYIEHLGSIHSTFRKLTAAREKQWAATMKDAMARYKQAINAGEKIIAVLALQTDGRRPVEEIQLFDEFFDHYKFLKRKNGTQANLSRRYVQWAGLPRLGE